MATTKRGVRTRSASPTNPPRSPRSTNPRSEAGRMILRPPHVHLPPRLLLTPPHLLLITAHLLKRRSTANKERRIRSARVGSVTASQSPTPVLKKRRFRLRNVTGPRQRNIARKRKCCHQNPLIWNLEWLHPRHLPNLRSAYLPIPKEAKTTRILGCPLLFRQ